MEPSGHSPVSLFHEFLEAQLPSERIVPSQLHKVHSIYGVHPHIGNLKLDKQCFSDRHKKSQQLNKKPRPNARLPCIPNFVNFSCYFRISRLVKVWEVPSLEDLPPGD